MRFSLFPSRRTSMSSMNLMTSSFTWVAILTCYCLEITWPLLPTIKKFLENSLATSKCSLLINLSWDIGSTNPQLTSEKAPSFPAKEKSNLISYSSFICSFIKEEASLKKNPCFFMNSSPDTQLWWNRKPKFSSVSFSEFSYSLSQSHRQKPKSSIDWKEQTKKKAFFHSKGTQSKTTNTVSKVAMRLRKNSLMTVKRFCSNS